jgi:hypothetical protein
MNASNVQFVHTLEKIEYNFLRKSVGWPELPDRQAAESLNNSAFFVAARYEGKAIGMTQYLKK